MDFWTIRKRKPLTQEFRVSIATSRYRLFKLPFLAVLGFLEVGRSATCEHGAFFSGFFIPLSNPLEPLQSRDVLSKDIKRLTFKY